MKRAHKKGREGPAGAAMFLLNLVFLALLAASTGCSGVPLYIQGQWLFPDESLQYEDPYGVAAEDRVLPESPSEAAGLVTMEDQTLLTTPDVLKEQESGAADESTVWKVILVAAVLLVSLVGSLSMAYYMCVWRGGRIHYQPQKEGYA